MCRQCGLLGHWACECPQPFDIRSIELNENEGEKEQLMYHLMAELDLVREPKETGEHDPEGRGFCEPQQVNCAPSLPVSNRFSVLVNEAVVPR